MGATVLVVSLVVNDYGRRLRRAGTSQAFRFRPIR
jgi:hypothetical protein